MKRRHKIMLTVGTALAAVTVLIPLWWDVFGTVPHLAGQVFLALVMTELIAVIAVAVVEAVLVGDSDDN